MHAPKFGLTLSNRSVVLGLSDVGTMLSLGAAADAAQTYGAILGEEPSNPRAVAGLAKAFAMVGQLDQAKAALDAAPAEIADDPAIVAARAQIDLAEQAADAGPLDELRAALEANPDDHQARLDLATALDPPSTLGHIEQDLPHRGGGNGIEVVSVVVDVLVALGEAEVGLVDQGGGVEGGEGAPAPPLAAGDASKLFVDEGKNFVESVVIPLGESPQKQGHFPCRGTGRGIGLVVGHQRVAP